MVSSHRMLGPGMEVNNFSVAGKLMAFPFPILRANPEQPNMRAIKA